MLKNRTLYFGDNLEILRERFPPNEEGYFDLIYLDPPFNSDKSYNILFKEGLVDSPAQVDAFEDRWHWTPEIIRTFEYLTIGTKQTKTQIPQEISELISGFEKIIGRNDLMAYLTMMSIRLIELHRVLKDTGSLYLHCDPTASHYLKVVLDVIFGKENFRNEIIWRRTAYNKSDKQFGTIHQTILFYAKTDATPFYPQKGYYTKEYVEKFFKENDSRGKYQPVALTGPGRRNGDSSLPWRGYNPTDVGRHWQPSSYLYKKYQELKKEKLSNYTLIDRLDRLDKIGLIHWGSEGTVPRYKYYLSDAEGVPYQDIWAYQPGTKGCIYENPDIGIDQDIKWLSTQDKERLGYPTQKPEGILERIIKSSSKNGDWILDPFCGCGTTVAVAEKWDRNWIGIDITTLATNLVKHRLEKRFKDKFVKENIKVEVDGLPKDIHGARTLFEKDPFEFQYWVLDLINARPTKGKNTNKKRGADNGIDGIIIYQDVNRRNEKIFKRLIVSVKGGKNISVKDIRDLKGVVEREKAEGGAFITLHKPTEPMIKEAALAGFCKNKLFNREFMKIQIITIDDLLKGKRLETISFAQELDYHNEAPKIHISSRHQQMTLVTTK